MVPNLSSFAVTTYIPLQIIENPPSSHTILTMTAFHHPLSPTSRLMLHTIRATLSPSQPSILVMLRHRFKTASYNLTKGILRLLLSHTTTGREQGSTTQAEMIMPRRRHQLCEDTMDWESDTREVEEPNLSENMNRGRRAAQQHIQIRLGETTDPIDSCMAINTEDRLSRLQ